MAMLARQMREKEERAHLPAHAAALAQAAHVLSGHAHFLSLSHSRDTVTSSNVKVLFFTERNSSRTHFIENVFYREHILENIFYMSRNKAVTQISLHCVGVPRSEDLWIWLNR